MHRGLFILQVLAEAAAAVASIAALIRIFRDYCLDDALSRKNRVFYKAMATVSVLDMELVPLLPLAGVEPVSRPTSTLAPSSIRLIEA